MIKTEWGQIDPYDDSRIKMPLALSALTSPFLSSRRDPSALTNGKKRDSMTEDPSSDQDNSKPKATRNILLIRHSQYNLSGNSDKERILTPLGSFSLSIRLESADPAGSELAILATFTWTASLLSGREQAELTGQRLASLGLKYDVLIHSSMTRATETAKIISKYLPGDDHSYTP